MKKFLALLLALVMVFALAACGESETTPSTAPTADPSSETSDTPEGVPANATEAAAQGRKVLTLNQHNSRESSNGQFTQSFVDYVNQNSDTLYIDAYYNGEHGGIQEALENAIIGTIDIGECMFAQFATFYPDMEVWSMPYLYTDPADGAKIVDLEKNTLLADMITECEEATGVTLLGVIYTTDARQLTCNFPVYTPDDLAGATIRSMTNETYTMCIEGMGGTPVPIDWTETISALTTGTVVGQENPYATLVSYQMWDCQDYVMETNHMFDFVVNYINTSTWESLTEEEQQVLRDGCAHEQQFKVEMLEEQLAEYKQTCIDNGMTIITEEDGLDLDAFKAGVDALKEERYPQYSEYFAWIDDYIANYDAA